MHPVYSYGMLVLILGLVAWDIQWYVNLPAGYSYDPYGNGIGALALLLAHLAFQFRWPIRVTIVLRILALAWLLFAFVYVFYLSRVLFPIMTP